MHGDCLPGTAAQALPACQWAWRRQRGWPWAWGARLAPPQPRGCPLRQQRLARPRALRWCAAAAPALAARAGWWGGRLGKGGQGRQGDCSQGVGTAHQHTPCTTHRRWHGTLPARQPRGGSDGRPSHMGRRCCATSAAAVARRRQTAHQLGGARGVPATRGLVHTGRQSRRRCRRRAGPQTARPAPHSRRAGQTRRPCQAERSRGSGSGVDHVRQRAGLRAGSTSAPHDVDTSSLRQAAQRSGLQHKAHLRSPKPSRSRRGGSATCMPAGDTSGGGGVGTEQLASHALVVRPAQLRSANPCCSSSGRAQGRTAVVDPSFSPGAPAGAALPAAAPLPAGGRPHLDAHGAPQHRLAVCRQRLRQVLLRGKLHKAALGLARVVVPRDDDVHNLRGVGGRSRVGWPRRAVLVRVMTAPWAQRSGQGMQQAAAGINML